MSSIAVGSSSSTNGTSHKNILKILSNQHRVSFTRLYAHFAKECSYFSNTPITSPNCADPFNSLANIKKYFSKRELKHIFKVLKGAYLIDVTIRLTSADRHEIVANKVWQLCCHMTSGHNWQRVISNYTATGLWTEQEQSLFKQGIELYGTEWNKIAELVSTRIVEQTMYHAKSYCKLKKKPTKWRRRLVKDEEGNMRFEGIIMPPIIASSSSSNSTKNVAKHTSKAVKAAHRASCHRCEGCRKNMLKCDRCPQVFCQKCVEKMIEEHGDKTFEDGCPVCNELCCCGVNRSVNCVRKFHCYRRCLATKKHRICYHRWCHHCGIADTKLKKCNRCPHVFCQKCGKKMIEEHGDKTFEDGCPVCNELCCCGVNCSVNCVRKFHCYNKCPATSITALKKKKKQDKITLKKHLLSMKNNDIQMLIENRKIKRNGNHIPPASALQITNNKATKVNGNHIPPVNDIQMLIG